MIMEIGDKKRGTCSKCKKIRLLSNRANVVFDDILEVIILQKSVCSKCLENIVFSSEVRDLREEGRRISS